MVRIALSAGHYNTTGGNHTEKELVGPITLAVAAHCRRLGMDVRLLQPLTKDGTVGTFPGTLTQLAQRVVRWSKEGWTPDVFLEVHAEDNGQGNRGRGCFAIYPNDPSVDDTDEQVRDNLGPAIALAIQAATGIPIRHVGTLSEQKTHVWTKLKSRLGIFAASLHLKKVTRRLIIEVGAYSAPADLTIMQQADFADRCGRAIAEAIAAYYRLPARRLFKVVVAAARTRQGPSTRFPVAVVATGTTRLVQDDVFAGDAIVTGETINGDPRWVHRADNIGFVSMALLEEQ